MRRHGGTHILVSDGLLPFAVESLGLKETFVTNVTPVAASCASLVEGFIHARLGLGSAFDDGVGGVGALDAGRDGKSGGWRSTRLIGWGLYKNDRVFKCPRQS